LLATGSAEKVVERGLMAAKTLDEAKRLIENRLKELRHEVQELEAALRRLGDSAAPTRRRPRMRQTGRRRSPGGRRTDRAEQFKRTLAKNPGARVSEIAKKMAISSQQGYGIAKRLRERGEIKKQGRGYSLKS
jgi:hypothetical protein